MVFGLLALLGLLAFLQYTWLTQIADAEKERLEKRLKLDAERFAEDFNKELYSTYFPFQISDENWRDAFILRYENWRQNTKLPQLIKGFTVLTKDNQTFLFNQESKQFEVVDSSTSFDDLKQNFKTIDEKNLTLQIPIFSSTPTTEEIKAPDEASNLPEQIKIIQTSRFSNVNGYILIKLDENTLKSELLPGLGQKYFPDGDYDFSIVSESDKSVIYQSNAFETADASVPFLSLTPNNLSFVFNKETISNVKKETISNVKNVTYGEVVLKQQFETKNDEVSNTAAKSTIKVVAGQLLSGDKSRIFSGKVSELKGLWNLNVRHTDGSLENFVSKTRNRNLAVSFGILLLLAVSIGLIFVSTTRARRFAQRQIEFVSSVSHEFRTPLAVIYSASENLTDGVVDSPENIAKYGNLIKREGKKLSGMVEQILEYAGANSGRQKYNFETVEVSQIIENALFECKSLIDEKDFTVEKNIAENIFVNADANALSHAMQNLIANSIKYSNGERFLKISTEKVKNQIKISVEDKGIGISSKDIKHIFEPFYRGKEVVDAQIHGNGLGLSLVKQIVDAHGGKVVAESETGKGSRFTIHLPISIQ